MPRQRTRNPPRAQTIFSSGKRRFRALLPSVKRGSKNPEAGGREGFLLTFGAMKRLAPALLLLASCVVVRQPEPNPGIEVKTAVEGMYADLSARRWDALEAHFLPEASLVFSTDAGVKRMNVPDFIEMVRRNTEG